MNDKMAGKKKSEKNIADLEFKPLNDGLGFHPFSDGMPYAPVSKSPQQIANRPLSYARNEPTLGSLNNTKTNLLQDHPPRIHVPIAYEHSKTGPVFTRENIQSQTPADAVQTSSETMSSYGLIYLLKRVIAYCLDTVFNALLMGGVLYAVFSARKGSLKLFEESEVWIFLSLAFIGFNWIFIILEETFFKTTLGKRLFGLEFRSSGVGLFFRGMSFPFSVLAMGLGLIWALIDKNKRCWHDLIFKAQPEEMKPHD
jgi:uncharacterized RDD family membrane protein YckC